MIPRRVVCLVLSICVVIFAAILPIFPAPTEAKTRVEANIFYPDGVYDISKLNALQSDLGVKFSAAKWYMDWATDFDATVANRFQSNGYIPELTWEPQLNGVGVAYDQVAAGSYDSYLIHNAQLIRSLGYVVRISLAPEMNTDWTPWGIGKQGNNRDNHKTFWQHVVQVFRAQGATNVKWVWSPNVRPWNAGDLYGSYADLYPGDAFVDYLGLDGYNWGTSQSWSEWQTFSQVFELSYNELTAMSGKDILIMEMASAEAGGNKAAWITDMFNQLNSRFSHIKGFTWFNINKETDWRITSSVSAKQSFTAGYLGVTQGPVNSSPKAGASTSQSGALPTNNQSALAKTTTSDIPTDGQVATATPTTSLATDANYQITTPILPKIAGVQSDRFNRSIQQLSLVLSLLLGVSAIAYLFNHRYRLIHAPVYADAITTNFFGLGFVDSVYLSSRSSNDTGEHSGPTLR